MNPILYLLSTLIDLYTTLLIAWLVLGLLVAFGIINIHQPLVHHINYALTKICEPALRPIRRYMPDTGRLDLSPIVLILLLNFLQHALFYYF